MRKIYIVGGGSGYANWMEGKLVDKMEQADLVLLTGGEDVSPSLYGEKAHPTNGFNPIRDAYEVPEFKKAIKLKKHIIGICRGSQLSCVMAGGKLVQHQDNPDYYHPIDTFDGKNILVSSTHHQSQYPWKMPQENYKVLGWTRDQSYFHFGSADKEMVNGISPENKEVEIAYYPKIKALAIQSHPEALFPNRFNSDRMQESILYCQDLLNKHMDDNL